MCEHVDLVAGPEVLVIVKALLTEVLLTLGAEVGCSNFLAPHLLVKSAVVGHQDALLDRESAITLSVLILLLLVCSRAIAPTTRPDRW